MKRVYSSNLLADVQHFKNVLEQAGIECELRNEQLTGGLGEIPFLECEPELWVGDSDAAQAEAIIAGERETASEDAMPWRCARCGEVNEPQFGACWQCNGPAP